MLYVDTPSLSEMQSLINHREPGCVSIYLPTTPLTKDAQGDRIQLRNLTKEVLEQLAAIKTHKKVIDAIADEAGDLIDDDEFWKRQANSLAVFISPNWSPHVSGWPIACSPVLKFPIGFTSSRCCGL
jgi:hypothetical protein